MTIFHLLAADAFTPSARQVAIIGILAAVVLYAYWFSRRKMTGGKWPKLKHSDLNVESSDASARNDLAKLLAQLDELSQQVAGRLDAKCAALEQTIHNADQRISALRTLLMAAQSAGVQLETGGATVAPSSSILKSEIDCVATASPGPGEPRASSLAHDRIRRIYELADKGRSTAQIAQETQQRIGEVELILNLRRSATAVSA